MAAFVNDALHVCTTKRLVLASATHLLCLHAHLHWPAATAKFCKLLVRRSNPPMHASRQFKRRCSCATASTGTVDSSPAGHSPAAAARPSSCRLPTACKTLSPLRVSALRLMAVQSSSPLCMAHCKSPPHACPCGPCTGRAARRQAGVCLSIAARQVRGKHNMRRSDERRQHTLWISCPRVSSSSE